MSDGWRDLAACRDPLLGDDRTRLALFFPHPTQSSAIARRVCAGCPVRVECLDEAREEKIRTGIRGGVSVDRDSRRNRRPPVRGRTHGTRSGYAGGCRCPECSEENRRYMASHRITQAR